MSENIPVNSDELWQSAVDTANAKRSANLGGGLTENSVEVLRRVRLSTGGVMTKAAQGAVGNNVRTRRILNLMICLDGSSSMSNKKVGVVDGLNAMFDELKDQDRSPQRNSIYVTIWIFRSDKAEVFKIGGQEIANIPVTQMPRIQLSDYVCSGYTPMNKTLLTAMGAGSLRTQQLAQTRKGAMNYLVCASDGKDNHKEEIVAGKKVTFYDHDVANVATDLLASEEWILAFAYAGPEQAKTFADAINFPLYRNIGDQGAESWRSFFGFVSQSVKTASKAVQQPGNQGASQIAGDNSNSFF